MFGSFNQSSLFQKSKPLRVSTELLNYYSQLIDTKPREQLRKKTPREDVSLQTQPSQNHVLENDFERSHKRKVQKVLRFQEPDDPQDPRRRKLKIWSQLNLKTEQTAR